MANPWDNDPVVGGKTSTPAEFAQVYGPAAERAAKTLGVDAKTLLGQWGLETGWGKSIVPGTNNLGNIKDFAGGGVGATDNMTGSKDKYRAYDSPEAFADDYASLIQRKYPNAVGAKDPLAFASALKTGGYAEDPRYVDKVVQASRMAGTTQNPVVAAVGKAVNAVVPSAQAAPAGGNPWDNDPIIEAQAPAKPVDKAASPDLIDIAQNATRNLGMGAVRGAGSIGATILAPYDMAKDAIAGKGLSLESNRQRRSDMDSALTQLGADPNSLAFQGGKLAGELAGTAGAGTLVAAPLKAAGVAPKLVSAIQSGGMTVGGAPATTIAQGAGNLATRVAGGAINGGVSAGLVNPEDAKSGATIGGAIPVVAKAAGLAGQAAGNVAGKVLSGGGMSPEVKALADRAGQLGIEIPADRLVNSRPMNALAASLDYVPLSGRAATMNKMEDQLNTAVSRTFGQDSPNVTQALRKAQADLGGKFDTVLQNNTVKVDNQFLNDLTSAAGMADKELGSDGARIIKNQVDEILAKASQSGDIDGQAAYNIKKTLDRISQRNSPEAFYARDLKQKLMDALNRSLGPQEAAAFATTRQQYGNMLAMEKIAQNGAEGGVSIGRLANMKNINNPDLQELADISAQFLKSREGAHGAAQRVGIGAAGAAIGGLPGLAAGMAAGRGANMLLNSGVVRNAMMGQPQTNGLLRFAGNPDLAQLFYRSAPVVGSQP